MEEVSVPSQRDLPGAVSTGLLSGRTVIVAFGMKVSIDSDALLCLFLTRPPYTLVLRRRSTGNRKLIFAEFKAIFLTHRLSFFCLLNIQSQPILPCYCSPNTTDHSFPIYNIKMSLKRINKGKSVDANGRGEVEPGSHDGHEANGRSLSFLPLIRK